MFTRQTKTAGHPLPINVKQSLQNVIFSVKLNSALAPVLFPSSRCQEKILIWSLLSVIYLQYLKPWPEQSASAKMTRVAAVCTEEGVNSYFPHSDPLYGAHIRSAKSFHDTALPPIAILCRPKSFCFFPPFKNQHCVAFNSFAITHFTGGNPNKNGQSRQVPPAFSHRTKRGTRPESVGLSAVI